MDDKRYLTRFQWNQIMIHHIAFACKGTKYRKELPEAAAWMHRHGIMKEMNRC